MLGTSLAVQWSGQGTARGIGSVPGWGTKILHAARGNQKIKQSRRGQNGSKIKYILIQDHFLFKKSFNTFFKILHLSLTSVPGFVPEASASSALAWSQMEGEPSLRPSQRGRRWRKLPLPRALRCLRHRNFLPALEDPRGCPNLANKNIGCQV